MVRLVPGRENKTVRGVSVELEFRGRDDVLRLQVGHGPFPSRPILPFALVSLSSTVRAAHPEFVPFSSSPRASILMSSPFRRSTRSGVERPAAARTHSPAYRPFRRFTRHGFSPNAYRTLYHRRSGSIDPCTQTAQLMSAVIPPFWRPPNRWKVGRGLFPFWWGCPLFSEQFIFFLRPAARPSGIARSWPGRADRIGSGSRPARPAEPPDGCRAARPAGSVGGGDGVGTGPGGRVRRHWLVRAAPARTAGHEARPSSFLVRPRSAILGLPDSH